jgi:hypothetical protein
METAHSPKMETASSPKMLVPLSTELHGITLTSTYNDSLVTIMVTEFTEFSPVFMTHLWNGHPPHYGLAKLHSFTLLRVLYTTMSKHLHRFKLVPSLHNLVQSCMTIPLHHQSNSSQALKSPRSCFHTAHRHTLSISIN